MNQKPGLECREQQQDERQSFQGVADVKEGWSRRDFLKISRLGLLERPLGETQDLHPDSALRTRAVLQTMLSSGAWGKGLRT